MTVLNVYFHKDGLYMIANAAETVDPVYFYTNHHSGIIDLIELKTKLGSPDELVCDKIEENQLVFNSGNIVVNFIDVPRVENSRFGCPTPVTISMGDYL